VEHLMIFFPIKMIIHAIEGQRQT